MIKLSEAVILSHGDYILLEKRYEYALDTIARVENRLREEESFNNRVTQSIAVGDVIQGLKTILGI